MPPSTQRLQQIATMYLTHNDQLRAVVYRRASQNLQILEDACSHAWTQLLATDEIDVRPPRWVALGWVTTTAVRHAWMLGHIQRRATATALPELDRCITERGSTAPASDELVAQRLRLDLITQIPERPRRFLLRLALGYSYAEIAAAEHASATTTNKQIARAKRILRDLEQTEAQHAEPCAPTPSVDAIAFTRRGLAGVTIPEQHAVTRGPRPAVWFAGHIQALPDRHTRKRPVCLTAFARDALADTCPAATPTGAPNAPPRTDILPGPGRPRQRPRGRELREHSVGDSGVL